MSVYKKMFQILLALLLTTSFSAMAEKGPVEGVHYKQITPAQPTSAPAGKVEVLEFFWYGCPHCFRFESHISKWLGEKSDNVVFTRIPAAISPKWELHARVYYAAEALGILEKIHNPLFEAIHVKRKRLNKKEDILDFIKGLGVDSKKFDQTMRSFAVSSKMQRAKKLGEAFNLDGVPSIVINGKYFTSGSLAGSYEGMIQLINVLSKKELSNNTASIK